MTTFRTLADGLARVARAALDPDYNPNEERLARLQAEHQAALLALAVAALRAQRDRP